MFASLILAAVATAAPMGFYTVPVKAELRPYASFDLACAALKTTDKGYRLEYDLPLELVDAAVRHVVLDEVSRDAGFVTMDGPEGHGICLDASDRYSCIVSYARMTIDDTAVQAYVDRIYPEPLEKSFRRRVAASFSGEPAGIIELPKAAPVDAHYPW